MYLYGLEFWVIVFVKFQVIQKSEEHPFEPGKLEKSRDLRKSEVSQSDKAMNTLISLAALGNGAEPTTSVLQDNNRDSFRVRRNANTEEKKNNTGSVIAQETNSADKKSSQLLSMVSPYAFGNPSLPDVPGTNSRRKRPRKPKNH